MPTETMVEKESPLWKSWESYTSGEEFANTERWAAVPEHLRGSLWAVFQAGYLAAKQRADAALARYVTLNGNCRPCAGTGEKNIGNGKCDFCAGSGRASEV